MSEYRVIQSEAMGQFQNAINKALSEGWECQGGILIVDEIEKNISHFFQAMTKSTPITVVNNTVYDFDKNKIIDVIRDAIKRGVDFGINKEQS